MPNEAGIQPPARLTGEARRCWDALAPDLARRGWFEPRFRLPFECLCRTYGYLQEAAALLDREGLTVAGPGGRPVVHPAASVFLSFSRSLRVWCQQFGCTPPSSALHPGPRGAARPRDAAPAARRPWREGSLTMADRVLFLVNLNEALEYDVAEPFFPAARWHRQRGPWRREVPADDAGYTEPFRMFEAWRRPSMAARRASRLVRERERELRAASGGRVLPAVLAAELSQAGLPLLTRMVDTYQRPQDGAHGG